MSVITTVTYTQWDKSVQAHREAQTRIVRPYGVTETGAQRIIRRDGYKDAIVTRVEYMGSN